MVEYGLHRLLIVLLMDALRPQDQFDLVRFIGCRIGLTLHSWKDYYAQCGRKAALLICLNRNGRFCRRHIARHGDKTPKRVCVLDFTIPSGNNHTHFDIESTQILRFPMRRPPGFCLLYSCFALRQRKGIRPAPNGAPPYFALIQGENLFETLVLSMIGLEDIRGSFDQPPAPGAAR